jgi:MFS transporter, SP family, sugar:H+ symporter
LESQGFIWGAFSVVTVAWVFFIVPEMKGFTIEQLDFLFDNRVPTRKFAKYDFANGEVAVESSNAGYIEEDLGKVDVKTSIVPSKHAVQKAL